MAYPGPVPIVGPNGSIRGLSDETILDILETGILSRRELVPLCLACKRLHRIAIVRLYRRMDIKGDQHLHQLLRSIFQNDLLGDLVNTLVVSWDGSRDSRLEGLHGRENDEGEKAGADTGDLEVLPDAARARPFEPEIVQALRQGSESAKVLVLLRSLPNLEVLSVSPPGYCQLFNTYFEHWARASRCFSKLKYFYRDHWDTEGGLNPDLLLAAFLIPSISTVSGFMVADDEEDGVYEASLAAEDVNYTQYEGTSNIGYIELTGSRMSGAALSRMLRLPAALKYFGFTEGDDILAVSACSREAFGRALQHTSHSLEFLSVEWDCGADDDLTTIGSLRGFKHLRRIEISIDLLLGVSTQNAAGLADVLPSSLERLILMKANSDDWSSNDYLESIEQLIRRKSSSVVPVLSSVGVGSQPTAKFLAPLAGLAAQKGIVLASYSPGNSQYTQKFFPILWSPVLDDTAGYKSLIETV